MGYETKLHFIEPYSFREEPQGGNLIATLDLCKVGYSGPVYDVLPEMTPNDPESWFIWASDGNTRIIRDAYNAPLGRVDPEQLLKALRKDNYSQKDPYRRFLAAEALLESLIDTFPTLVVLTEGH